MGTDREVNAMLPVPVVPEAWKEEMRTYLNDLRRSGVTNMFGASEYLEAKFGLTRKQGRDCLTHWMTTFTESDR